MCRNAHDFFVVSDTLITFMACNINDKLMTVTDRFLKYVTFDTESSETTGVTPSTPGQRVFAEALVKELEEIGLEDITLDDKSYLMATLPANTAKEVPTIGFIAHLDTSPDKLRRGGYRVVRRRKRGAFAAYVSRTGRL